MSISKILSLVFLLLSLPCFAHFNLNPIVLKNRAQCAIDSQNPTQSVFLIADGYNAGRIAYNFAKTTSLDAKNLAVEGMKTFQKSIGSLQKDILEKMLAGKLPLLDSKDPSLPGFYKASKECNNEVYCPNLNFYISKIWNESKKENPNFKTIDSFTASHFLEKNLTYGCYFLKDFSPLQSHLYQTQADREQLRSIGITLSSSQSPFIECSQSPSEIDSDHFAIQMDIQSQKQQWNSIGYSFWYSLKIYTSWAFRYSEESQKGFGKFKNIFKNLDLEESLLFVSNGCESIEKPECDSNKLSLNSLRELAKIQVQTNEFDSHIPPGPQQELLTKGARDVNNDFLSLLEYSSASEWVQNFRKNFTSQQWLYRNKVFQSYQNISFIAANKSPSELASDIFSAAKEYSQDESFVQEVLYLCTEWNFSSNKEFDFIRSDIEQVKNLQFLQDLNMQNGLSIEKQIEYFEDLSLALKPVCDSLRSQGYYDTLKSIDWSGLNSWAQELSSKVLDLKSHGIPVEPLIINNTAYLTLPNSSTPICINPMNCARNVIRSAVDLYAVSTYGKAFLNHHQIQSSEMMNPYSELLACQVYDPWYQKNRTRKRLLADLANVALFGWNQIPAYVDIDFSAPRVTSFNSLVENGILKFAPEIQKSKALTSFIADLGPLAGAPCAVAISPNSNKAFNFYSFGGITVNACTVTSKRELSYKKAKNPVSNSPQDRAACGGCTLNFVGVTSALSHQTIDSGFNPVKSGVYMFRALYRFFKGMRDPINIPKSQVLNLENIQETFELYDDIPQACVKPLSEGNRCINRYCENAATLLFEKTTGKTSKRIRLKKAPKSYGKNFYKASIVDDECRQKHDLYFQCDESTQQFNFLKMESKSTRKCKNTGAISL